MNLSCRCRCASVVFYNTPRCVSVVLSSTNESLISISIGSCKDGSVSLICRVCVYSVKGACELIVIKAYDSKTG